MTTAEKQPVKLTLAKARVEHARLGAEIAEHDRRYHGEDQPTISDAEYDELRRRYTALEAAFPDLAGADSESRIPTPDRDRCRNPCSWGRRQESPPYWRGVGAAAREADRYLRQ